MDINTFTYLLTYLLYQEVRSWTEPFHLSGQNDNIMTKFMVTIINYFDYCLQISQHENYVSDVPVVLS